MRRHRPDGTHREAAIALRGREFTDASARAMCSAVGSASHRGEERGRRARILEFQRVMRQRLPEEAVGWFDGLTVDELWVIFEEALRMGAIKAAEHWQDYRDRVEAVRQVSRMAHAGLGGPQGPERHRRAAEGQIAAWGRYGRHRPSAGAGGRLGARGARRMLTFLQCWRGQGRIRPTCFRATWLASRLRDIKKFWASVMRRAEISELPPARQSAHLCLSPGLERLEPGGGWAPAGPHQPEHDQALRPPC